jgi:adenosylhomocysteine nucleosidase
MATVRSRTEGLPSWPVEPLDLTFACALRVEEKIARRGGAKAVVVGQGASLPLPDGRLVSFGFAGGLEGGLEPGTLLTATKVVDPKGRVLWEGEPLEVPAARPAVICWSADGVVNEPEGRRALAASSGAMAVDMESGRLAETGRLAGVVRAISDTGERSVGALANAGRADGGTDWKVVARAFVTDPMGSIRTTRDARKAIKALHGAAEALS